MVYVGRVGLEPTTGGVPEACPRHALAVQVIPSGCFTGTATNFLMVSEPGFACG